MVSIVIDPTRLLCNKMVSFYTTYQMYFKSIGLRYVLLQLLTFALLSASIRTSVRPTPDYGYLLATISM